MSKIRMEGARREVQEAANAVSRCGNIIGVMLSATTDDAIPLNLDQLAEANADKYREAVQAAKEAVNALSETWPE